MRLRNTKTNVVYTDTINKKLLTLIQRVCGGLAYSFDIEPTLDVALGMISIPFKLLLFLVVFFYDRYVDIEALFMPNMGTEKNTLLEKHFNIEITWKIHFECD